MNVCICVHLSLFCHLFITNCRIWTKLTTSSISVCHFTKCYNDKLQFNTISRLATDTSYVDWCWRYFGDIAVVLYVCIAHIFVMLLWHSKFINFTTLKKNIKIFFIDFKICINTISRQFQLVSVPKKHQLNNLKYVL